MPSRLWVKPGSRGDTPQLLENDGRITLSFSCYKSATARSEEAFARSARCVIAADVTRRERRSGRGLD